jgi:hypothetical protein
MRLSRNLLLAVLLVVVAATVLPRWCARDQRKAIRVEEDRVVVTNLTGAAWSDVTVWLNDYYRAQTSSLAPDQRLDVPLNGFIEGWGRRFDRRRQSPVGIQVTARGADGKAVTLTWGAGRRR